MYKLLIRIFFTVLTLNLSLLVFADLSEDPQQPSDDHDAPFDQFIDDNLGVEGSIPADDGNKCTYKEALQQLSDYPEHLYPYDYLPSLMEAQGQESIKLFVYGSLMDYRSASQTLCSSTLKTRELARAYRVKAIYNRSMPYVSTPHWGVPENPYAIAMLNTVVSEKFQDIALGVLFNIPVSSIASLLSREVGYDLKPVIVQPWTKKESALVKNQSRGFKVAYVLSSPTPSQYTGTRLFPREGYYQRIIEAVRANGEAFYQEWLENTYLADGMTSVGYYELFRERGMNEFDKYDCLTCTGL
ncbi:MAG: hypothetical protein ACPGEF_03510 [Endozoicomonas sp.]